MSELVVGVLLLIGGLLMLVAGVGVIRMPDLYTRMQAMSKVATLGVAFVILAVAVHFGDWVLPLLVIAFFLLTAPIAAHRIARAAHFAGVPLWERTTLDELRGRYDPATHELAGESEPTEAVDRDRPERGPARR